MFTFFVLDWEHLFWANLVWKFKIVCLSWILGPRLIPISKFRSWYLPFFIFRLAIIFFGKFSSKNSKVFCLRWNLLAELTRKCGIWWSYSVFLFLIKNTIFWNVGSNYQRRYKFLFKLFNLVIAVFVLPNKLKFRKMLQPYRASC